MHTASYQKLDTASDQKLNSTFLEGLGTRLTFQIPPKGVYSSVARESGYGRDPLVVGVALERLNLQVQLYARVVITVIYLEILLLQSKQCLRRLNLTSQTFLQRLRVCDTVTAYQSNDFVQRSGARALQYNISDTLQLSTVKRC